MSQTLREIRANENSIILTGLATHSEAECTQANGQDARLSPISLELTDAWLRHQIISLIHLDQPLITDKDDFNIIDSGSPNI